MCETYLDKFKQEMEPAKKIYTEEIKKLAENYDFFRRNEDTGRTRH